MNIIVILYYYGKENTMDKETCLINEDACLSRLSDILYKLQDDIVEMHCLINTIRIYEEVCE